MTKRKKRISFDDLPTARKEAIWRECERIRPEDGKPLTVVDRRLHRVAGVRFDASRDNGAARRIVVPMEWRLLRSADRYARTHGMTRARLIVESVKAYLSSAA